MKKAGKSVRPGGEVKMIGQENLVSFPDNVSGMYMIFIKEFLCELLGRPKVVRFT